ncbi:hypothetical protein Plhal703r1_c07g0041471 [Plasmopara halstedii]
MPSGTGAWDVSGDQRPLGDSKSLYGSGGAGQDAQPPGLRSTFVDWIGLSDTEEWLYRVREIYRAVFMGDLSLPATKCKTSYRLPRDGKVRTPKTL